MSNAGIKFIVTGLPRSCTTWTSNWLSVAGAVCYHDPLYQYHYEDWDSRLAKGGAFTGVSCTGIWRWPEFLASHPAKKLIINRGLHEVNTELLQLGVPPLPTHTSLAGIDGLHIQHTDLFCPTNAKEIWEWLGMPGDFDGLRHELLCSMDIQPRQSTIKPNRETTIRLYKELARIVR